MKRMIINSKSSEMKYFLSPFYLVSVCIFNNLKKVRCFFPIPQAADCILRMVERANAPVIFLSTDAAESVTDLLQSLVVLNGKSVPLTKWPKHNSADKRDAV